MATQTPTKTTPPTPKWPRWVPAAVIAIAALVIGVAVVLFTGDTEAPTATEPPPTTLAPEESTPTVVDEEATPTTLAEEPEVENVAAFTGNNDSAGAYRTLAFQPAFEFTLPEAGWEHLGQTSNYLWIAPPGFNDPGAQTIAAALTVNVWEIGSFDESVDFLQTHEALDADEPTEVTVGGAPGVRFNAVSLSGGTLVEGDSVMQPGYSLITGHQYLMYVLDVDGTVVTISADSPDAELYAEYMPSIEGIINSIVWETGS